MTALAESAIHYLLVHQRARTQIEKRAYLTVLVASLGFGVLFAWLVGNLHILLPFAAGSACLMLCVVRWLGDSGTLRQLLVGNAWREMRLTQLHSEQVIDGILLYGLKQQTLWTVIPAALMAQFHVLYGLPWLIAVTLGCVTASLVGMFSVVQQAVPQLLLRPYQVAALWVGVLAMIFAANWLSPLLLLVLIPLWLLATVRWWAANGLAQVAEGFSLAATRKSVQRSVLWAPWSDNPIVARECARESTYLGNNWALAIFYFLRWPLLLVAIPATYLRVTPLMDKLGYDQMLPFLGSAILLVIGAFQGLRSATRVFSALSAERDAQTLDLLLVTALEPEEFVSGWAQVGYVARQFEYALVVLASLGFAYSQGAHLSALGMLAWAGLVGLGLCVVGAYCGLLFGFQHCARIKRKRDLLFPGVLACWCVLTLVHYSDYWLYLPLHCAGVWVAYRFARSQALRCLRG